MRTIEKRKELKELSQRVKILEIQIAQEVRDCRHEFEEAIYNPIETPKQVVAGYEQNGVHQHPIMKQDGFTREDQWTRTCKLCGHEQHTKKQKFIKTVPDFRN